MSARSLVYLTLDSCRFDTFHLAYTPFFDSLGTVEPGRSHGDSTGAGHWALYHGHLPDCAALHGRRAPFGPWLFPYFKRRGYQTILCASLPYAGAMFQRLTDVDHIHDTPFEREELKVRLDAHLEWLEEVIDPANPTLLFMNIGETHFPYGLDLNAPKVIERLSQDWSERKVELRREEIRDIRDMHSAQMTAVQWVDMTLGGHLAPMFKDKDPVWLVTADHGECFGEDHLFGHAHGCYEMEVRVPVLCSDWDWVRSQRGTP